MKRIITFLVLLFGVLSSLMAETYVTNNEESMTLYFPIECWRDELGVAVFSSENDYAQAKPYKQVKASKVNSMYMGGRQVYKAVVPFISSPTIVSFYFGDNFVHSSGTYRNELTEPGTWYYCYDVNSSIGDRKGVWYRSFDEARFGAQMIDINLKPETNVLYFIEGELQETYVTVYSSEYGESQGKTLYDRVYLEGLVNGKKCFYFTIDNADVFDMVKYYYHGTSCRDRIDWSKPFFYQGEWYASLDVIPFKELFYEYSCWYIEGEGLKSLLNRTVLNLYHIGNNVYELTLNKNVAGADKVFDIKLNNGGYSNTCVNFVKTITVPEQTGKYNITFTYDANTQDLTHEWELVSTDGIYVSSSDIKFLGSSYWENLDAKMELVGVNEYKYTCKAEMEKGLKYYSIYDDYSGFKAKDILFQIPETWLYEFTFTYNAVTQKYACDVKKSYDFDPIYFRGTVNEWGVDEKYKLISTDGDYYVATYAAGKEVELGDPEGGIAKFKIGSGNDKWRPINFGYSKSQYEYLTAGTPCILASGGSDVSIVGSLKASKIEFTKSTGTLLVTAAQAESEYTTVYVVNEKRFQNIYAFARPINSTDYDDVEVEKLPKTYQGYEVYSYTFKSIYDQLMINGTGGNSINYFTVNKVKPYYYDGVWYETLNFDTESEGGEGGEGGDDNGNDNTGGDNTGGDDEGGEVTPPTPTEFDLTTDQGVAFVVNPNSANPVFVPLTHSYNAEFQTAQYTGTYTVTDLDFTAKIGGLTNLDVINYGTNGQALAPKYVYDPTRGASNGFTITGDYKVGDILNINATFDSYWNVALIIDVTKILEPTPNDITLYYVNSNEWDTVNGYVWPTGGTGLLEWPGSPATKIDKTVDGYDVYSYTFDSTAADNIIFNAGLGGAQTKDLAVNASKPYYYGGVWYETLTFDGEQGGDEGGEEGGDDTDPIVPETSAYVVRGNGGSDATGIWCGGIEWTNDDSPVNNMTDADKDGIYEVTYKNVPAGTWNFKVVGTTEGWMGSDFLDTENSSAGYTTAPYDGNIGFTLNAPADVTIKFNTLTGKIIVTTPSGSFGKVVIEHFHILTGNNQCLDEFEFTEANNYTLVLTQEVIIDEEYGVAYVGCGILGNCDYAVYEKYFSIEVTENGTYTVTVQFNGDYENPDFTVTAVKQGGSDEPIVKDPVISDIAVPTFPQTEVGEIATATLTYTLENATSATATVEAPFYIQSQSVVNGKGSVEILFMPEEKGVHTATLSIKSGNVTETTMIIAKAVEPAPEVVPTIKNVVIPAFTSIEKGTATSVTATFTLENATEVSAKLSGTGKDAFVLGQPDLNGGNGSVKIVFMPTEAGTYTATLTLTSGKAVQTATISAVATEPAPQVSITNIQVPAFDEIYVGDFTAINVTYTLENATKSSVSISGTNADVFIAQNNKVTNGKGSLQVIFLPESAGLYTATLTITAGDVSESVTLVAIAKLEQTEDPGETVVNISNLQVPEFASVVENETTTVIASYVLTGAKDATARISGTDAKYFTILSQEVSEGIGRVEIEFAPNAARTFNATLTIISGTESESIDFSASALAAPVISNIQVPEFAETYVDETQTVLATYTLENAEAATATLSGDVEVFSISKQILSGGNGLVRIDFAPKSKGTYKAKLIITSGKVTESVNFSATAIVEETEELPVISNLNVPAFDEVYEGESAIVIATYTLENATEATATLSGDDVFSILRSLNGKVLIEFAPAEAGTYNGTLTITSGSVSESINFSAEAVKEGGEEPGPGPIEPEKPDPLPSYPVRGYMYVVNTPDADLERMVKYRPVSIDTIDYFLAPEIIETKIYGYDIYKFEVRDKEKIDLWEYPNNRYTSWHINVNADLSATPYRANGVWYASIEEMMTWYVSYIPNWDDEASEVMIEESPGVYVATFDAFAESDDDDKYYYCLGNVENPILEVGVSEYGVIQNYLQIPQGFKAMIYLDDTNWETEWKTYYKLVPPGKDWNRDCIDLGLSSGLCWATKNLGATEPQQEGTHFAWGEVEPKEDYSYNTYKWANLLKNNEYIKYVTDDYWGTIVDFRTILEPTDDAVNVALEGKWHMPTQADVEELLRECTTEFGSYYGVNGYFVTGPNGNAIFLPAVGIKEGTRYEESTRDGDYWTSSLYENNQAYAVTLSFALTYIEVDDMRRTNGLAIRPVIHRDYVGIEEVVAINVYAKDHTIYCEEPFQIYTVTGLEVTHLNGALEGVYIVKTEKGNQLISVW